MALDKLQTFKLDPRDAKKLERIAKARETSVGAVIRDAIRDAIYGPGWAIEVVEEIKNDVESEYASRFAILETAKEQIEEKIKTLTKDAENLTEKMAELLQKESAIDEPNEALEVRKQYKELRDLLDITNERLESAKKKHAEILRAIAQLENDKNQALNAALRQAFPRVCEPLLEGITARLADVANALRPYLAAFASAGTPEHLLAKFLWLRLGEMARGKNSLAYDLLGKPSPLSRSNYESWQSFWRFWTWQTGCKLPIESEIAGDQEEAPEELREETQVQIEA
jgi:type II secretory pathway component PulJ/predicted transcriptional regulator